MYLDFSTLIFRILLIIDSPNISINSWDLLIVGFQLDENVKWFSAYNMFSTGHMQPPEQPLPHWQGRFMGPPLFPRSRMLTRIDGKGLMPKKLKNLISTEFFGSIQCYRKVNRMVKWHEGIQNSFILTNLKIKNTEAYKFQLTNTLKK